MTIWTCNICGCVERLNFMPDCCSLCGGTLETQDGRSTAARDFSEYEEAHCEAMEAAMRGETADPAEIISLWHDGQVLTSPQQAILDDLLHANRITLMAAVYADIREAA